MNSITYCGNVHPSNDLKTLLKNISDHHALVARDCPTEGLFPTGLWIPEHAITEVMEGSQQLQNELEQHRLELSTLNAFPMGVFHGTAVKERVYLPDWSSPQRMSYTQRCAKLGAHLGIERCPISTVSGGFRSLDDQGKVSAYIQAWVTWVRFAQQLEDQTGCCVPLALEPEPFNTMEDHNDAIALWPRILDHAQKCGLDQQTVNRYLGLCFDTCHFSVRFVLPRQAWLDLKAHQIPVHKIQVSVAPTCPIDASADDRTRFFDLAEPTYLHQSYHRDPQGNVSSFLDLPQAKNGSEQLGPGEWRTHFHVPIHWGDQPHTTGAELCDFLNLLKLQIERPLLEIETYSFSALQGQGTQPEDLNSSLIREWHWLNNLLAP
jgi:hypothetical protein